jgi:hypothetical protein
MFQFAPFATYAYGFSVRQVGNPGINTRLTAPPGLSQSSTPVIAFCSCDHHFRGSKPRLTPRSAVGFFGSGGRAGHPAEPITQPTSEQLRLVAVLLGRR